MLDNLMIQAVEQAFHFGFPPDAGAVLIIEVDGLDAGLDREAQAIAEIVQAHGGSRREVDRLADPQGARVRRDLEEPQVGLRRHRPAEPDLLHPGRRRPPHQAAAHPPAHHRRSASGTTSGSPTSSTPATATSTRSCSSTSATPTRCSASSQASHEILDECIAVGGSVTGEHGIGVEKMEFMPKLFSPEDLAAMVALRNAFNPDGRCSPAKMLPGGAGCIEQKSPRRAAPA